MGFIRLSMISGLGTCCRILPGCGLSGTGFSYITALGVRYRDFMGLFMVSGFRVEGFCRNL